VSVGPTESRSGPGPKVFITYRREETAAHAGRLYDAMVARFGEANVFMDVDMAPGVDFVEGITEAVAACHVLIVVMGPRWATVKDEQGRARLADPEDFVRLEVETALRRPDVTPIPVLVAGARMPNREDLPPEVRAITRRNALELGDQRWRYDVGRLISTLDELLAASPLVAGSPSPDRTVATGKAPPADAAQTAGQTAPPSTVAGPTSGETKPAVPPVGGGRRMRWALLGALAVAAIVVAVVFAVSGGGGGGDEDQASEARLLKVIPASVRQEGCERAQGAADAWMEKEGAEVSQVCRPLPTSALSEAFSYGDLTYGLFPSAGKARDVVKADFDYEVKKNESMKSESCGEKAERQMKEDYPGGHALCYTNKDGVFMNWIDRGSPVAAQLYLNPRGSADAAVDAAVAARAQLL
jgi:hypothetical protein